jgi:hypothetical protein
MKFTLDVSKCDKIFDELLRNRKIKLFHTMPPIEDLKKRAYCKWHNSHSHATNDCNVFRWQYNWLLMRVIVSQTNAGGQRSVFH